MVSRTKAENIFGIGFNLVNIMLYTLSMAASMMKAIVEHQSVSQILTCIYAFLLAAWLIAMETKSMDIPIYYFRIFTLYRGRSLLLILLGCITLGSSIQHPFLLAAGILNLSFGVIYFILSFVPGAPTPRHANENWQNWKEYSAEGLDLERPPTKQDDNNQNLDNAARLRMSMVEKPPQNKKVSPVEE